MLTKQEIRQLGNKEMMDELQKTRRELLKSQFDVRNGTNKETHMVKNLKRYIARLQTISKEMKIDGKTTVEKAKTTPVVAEKKAPAKKAAAPKKAAAAKKTTAVKSKTTKSAKK